MARVLPPLTPTELAGLPSQAEARFYEACRDRLPEDTVVIYSAGWVYRDKQGRLREGEADFTILSPTLGLFAVEVKGGGIEVDGPGRQWHSIDRHGKRHPIKDPFRQAAKERYALLDQVQGHASWRQWRGQRLVLGHAVLLPDIRDAAALVGTDRPRELIGLGDDLIDPTRWLERVARFWRQPGDEGLGAQGVRLVEDILCKSVEVKPALRSHLEQAELQRIRLTRNQAKILRTIGGRQRAVISGGAGTGKTLIAVEKARQLAQAGQQVLLLCFNRPLAEALAASLADEPRIQAISFHQLADRRIREANAASGRDLLAEAAKAYPGEGNKHLFDVQMPYAMALAGEVLTHRFDALVVDEAQDFSDDHWLAITDLLRDPAHGPLFLFTDPNQAVYRREGTLPVADEPFHLTVNCRNTAPIHEIGYRFYQGEEVDAPDLPGVEVTLIGRDTAAEQAAAIGATVSRWLTEDAIPERDIVVLVARWPKAESFDLIKSQPLPGRSTWAFEQASGDRTIRVDTVARFKGLESQAVVLWLGDDAIKRDWSETIYVGLTRAKGVLAVAGSTKINDIFKI
jgi:hypothetical protein